MKSARWFVSYIAVALVGLGLAFALSLRFMQPAHSQNTNLEAPSSGDLPPEFLNEANKEGAKAPTSKTPDAGPAAKADSTATSAPPVAAPPEADSRIDEATAAEPTIMGAGGDGYVYDPTGRRDPFAPYQGVRPIEKKIVLEPLQHWELDRLKVVGILWEVRNPRAMLKDPDGHVHMIMKNTKIGRNSGYVAAIREGEVVVVEMFDVEGSINKETKILELGK